VVDADPLIIYTDIAVPLALIVNELITNAIQHACPLGEDRDVRISLMAHAKTFCIHVSDSGNGPVATQSPAGLGTRHVGLGTRIVETLARQIDATITKERSAVGYTVTVTVPHEREVPDLPALA
jgi:two-component sensor histidine kinase